jgi:F0F1-type ATP synthase delta subunit
MKYKPELYAKAFAEVVGTKSSPAEEKKAVQNLISIVVKNGDAKALPKILEEADRLLRRKLGIRKIKVASARPLEKHTEALVKKLLMPKDVIEEEIDPSLRAGITITVDDEMYFDGSLKRKLEKLFRT